MIKKLAAVLAFLLIGLPLFHGKALASEVNASQPAPDKIQYEALRFELPQAERVVLDNGMVLYILENHELPLVNIGALIKTGTMYDPTQKEGTGELTAYVMRTGGTAKMKSADIDRQLDQLAASVSVSIARESAQIGFSILNTHLEQGLNLLSQIIISPAFEPEKFELARQLKNEEIRRLKDDPQGLAFQEFNRLIYQGDPRGRFPSLKSLARIQRDDLVQFHNRFFLPNNAMFAVSGDISRDDVLKLFRQYFGSWKKGNLPEAITAPVQQSKPGIYLIDKDIPQSTVISGLYTIDKNHPDFYAFSVLDFILGSGGFPSRIVNVVRNSEGLAYSAGSFYRARTDYGIFGSYAFTKTSSTMKALALMDDELAKLLTHPITEKELNWAKKSIIDGFIFSFATPEQIVWQQMNVDYEKLPADYLRTYRDKIEKVSVEKINRTAVKYLDKNKNVVLILGDRKKMDQPAPGKEFVLITPEE